MKRKQQNDAVPVSVPELDRRGFITGIGAVLGSLPLQTLAATPADPLRNSAALGTGQPRRAIHQELAYLDHEGVGHVYDAPRGNQATRDYVNSLTQEQFLRRHWFT
jgi:hypothetical protein